MAKNLKKIIRPNLILCEGVDALYFLIYWMEHMIKQNDIFDSFQVMDAGGNDELPMFLNALKNVDGFENVHSLTVVRDAETNAHSAVRSIQSSFDNCGFPVPSAPCNCSSSNGGIKAGFVLFPSCGEVAVEGTLEDLCLDILGMSDKGYLRQQSDLFLHSVRENTSQKHNRSHKNVLHTMLSATDKFVSMKIGEAAKAQAFDFDCAQLKSMANFLVQMSSGGSD